MPALPPCAATVAANESSDGTLFEKHRQLLHSNHILSKSLEPYPVLLSYSDGNVAGLTDVQVFDGTRLSSVCSSNYFTQITVL